MPEPKIFTKNYVSGDDVITVSHGDGSKVYLYDRDVDSKWTTSGANDDATLVSIEVEFKEGQTAVDRTIDSFIMVNHNLKAWTLYYWDGDSWEELSAETTDDQSVSYVNFSEVTTSKIKLEADETQAPDEEKEIGEMIVCALQVDMGDDIDLRSYEPRYRERTRQIPLGDGSVHQMVTRWTVNRTQKYEARVSFDFLTEAQRATLKAICEAREPFLWYPESVYRPSEIFLVRWANTWTEKYISTFKGSGTEIQMDLKEV